MFGYKEVDKTKFRRGVWDNEPDFLEWTDEETGYKCSIIRNDRVGNLCGYVYAPDIQHELQKLFYGVGSSHSPFNVHGGITYFSYHEGIPVLGFDCAHWGDSFPFEASQNHDVSSYKDINYVKKECESLASQLRKLHSIFIYLDDKGLKDFPLIIVQ